MLKERSGPNQTPLPLGPSQECARLVSCFKCLPKLAVRLQTLCLQETHDLPFEVLAELGVLLPGWEVLHSSCQDVDALDLGAAGGVANVGFNDVCLVCMVRGLLLMLIAWSLRS